MSVEYIRTHIKELEDETCKIISKGKATKITISQLDEETGCFWPIQIIDITECKFKLGGNPELFEVEVE